LLDDLRRLAQDMARDGNLGESTSSGLLMKEMYKELMEMCKTIAETEPELRDIVGQFPKIVRGGRRAISVHLCVSDIWRLGPDPCREITVWLTVVDLNMHNPVKVGSHGMLTPTREGLEQRKPYVVKGEIVYMRTRDEIDAEERQKVAELEAEIKRQISGRVDRARSARGDSPPSSSGSVRNFPTTEAEIEEAASKFAAAAEAGSSKSVSVFDVDVAVDDPEEQQDARELEEMKEEVTRLRKQREARNEDGAPAPAAADGSPLNV